MVAVSGVRFLCSSIPAMACGTLPSRRSAISRMPCTLPARPCPHSARAIASKSASGPAALSTASSASLNGLLLGRPPGLPDWPFLNPPLPVGFPGFRILQQACSQVYLRRDRGLLLQRRILLPLGPTGMVTVHCRHASVAAHERRLTRLPERMPLYMTICGNHLASRTPRGHRVGLWR